MASFAEFEHDRVLDNQATGSPTAAGAIRHSEVGEIAKKLGLSKTNVNQLLNRRR